MPQPPILADQLQIEPGSAGSRLVRRAADGSLEFVDPSSAAGITLSQLAGLQAVTNVLVVGKAGTGAQYTTVQDALDAIPSTASPINPFLILVMPGVYSEDLVFNRDGVQLVGFGFPVLQSALEATPNGVGNDSTITITAGLGTTPQQLGIRGFKITNAHDGKACIRIVGAAASTLLGGYGLVLQDCDLEGNGAGGNRTLWGTAANNFTARDCRFKGNNQALFLCEEMSRVEVHGGDLHNAVSFRYDTANDQPVDASGQLVLHRTTDLGVSTALVPAVAIDCDSAGGSQLYGCTMGATARLQYSGDRTHTATGCTFGVLSLLETPTLKAPGTSFASLLAPNLNAELQVDTKRGTVVFAAATAAVAFDVPMFAGDTYDVAVEAGGRPVNDETPWITAKTVAGFTINFQTAQILTAGWRITRV